jgi:hypothetical protein
MLVSIMPLSARAAATGRIAPPPQEHPRHDLRFGMVRIGFNERQVMPKIQFKTQGHGNGFHNSLQGWYALGERSLSAICVRTVEAEEEANLLRKEGYPRVEVDEALAEARRKFKETGL